MVTVLSWPPPPQTIVYTLSQARDVSLAIYDSTGTHLLRELLRAAPRAAGMNTEYWDGIDQQGTVQSAGNYTWKMLQSGGLTAQYVLTLGSSAQPPFSRWPGGYGGGPHAVAVDATGMYVMAGSVEGAPMMIGQSFDGSTHLWDYDNGAADNNCCADGGMVYWMNSGVVRGNVASNGSISGVAYDVRWSTNDVGALMNMNISAVANTIADMAVKQGVIVVSYLTNNAIRWYSATNGVLLGTASINAPLGVAMDMNGLVYAISDGAIYTLTGPGATPTQLVASAQLTSPVRLDVDVARDTLYVVEAGASQQIKRFTAAGVYQQSYGAVGGRQRYGLYDNTGFDNVSDIVCDGQGGYIVTEPYNAPRRTARYAQSGGAPIKEWYGGQQWWCQAAPDPTDNQYVWITSNYGDIIQAQVNYTAQTWTVHACYQYEYACGSNNLCMTPVDNGLGATWFVCHRSTNTYLYTAKAPLCILRVDEANRRLLPVAGAMSLNGLWDTNLWPQVYRDAMTLQGHDWNADHTGYYSFTWSDQNENGTLEASEVMLHNHGVGSWAFPSGQGTLNPQTWAWTFASTLSNYGAYATLAPSAWTADNLVPQYDWSNVVTGAAWPATVDSSGGPWAFGVDHSTEGNGRAYQMCASKNSEGYFPVPMFNQYKLGATHLFSWDTNGVLNFEVAKHFYGYNEQQPPPGQFKNPFTFIGATHNCAVIGDRFWSPSVYDYTGLYVGNFFDHHISDGLPEWVYHYGYTYVNGSWCFPMINFDNPGGQIVTSGDSVYWYAAGQNANAPVYKITGWDSLSRSSGTVTVEGTPDHAAGNGDGLSAQYFNNLTLSGAPVLTRVEPQVWTNCDVGVSPAPGVNATNISARWTGMIEAPLTDDYNFSLRINDGARLWIGGRLVLDYWTDDNGNYYWWYPDELRTDAIHMEAGKAYAVTLELYKKANDYKANLFWENTAFDPLHIPQKYLYSTSSNLPTVTITLSSNTVMEGGTSTLTVTRTGATDSALTVKLGYTGTATAGADYEALPDSVTIPAGSASTSLTITTINDSVLEPRVETLRPLVPISSLYLVNDPATPVELRIVDDESLPVGGVSVTNPSGDNPQRMVNGSGLNTAPLIPTHDANPANMYYYNGNSLLVPFVFDLGNTYDLTSFRIWNYNDPADLTKGVRDAEVLYATEANPTQFISAGTILLTPGSGVTGYEGQQLETNCQARYVELKITGDFTPYPSQHLAGFSEIEFYGRTGSNNVVNPTFSPKADTYASTQSVTISTTTGGATIRYTTDGSSPSETVGTVYSNPVNIGVSTRLKAIAYKSGLTKSGVTSGMYDINGALANFFNVLYAGSRTNWAGSMGFEFKPSSDINVTALGRAVSGSMIHNHTIRIWKVSGQSVVGSVTVTPSSATDSLGYKYEYLTSLLTLTSGTVYRIASTETNGADAFGDVGLISNHTANASISGYAYGWPDSVYPGSFAVATNQGYVPPTFYTGGTLPAATPTFNPVAGTYTNGQSVTISTTTGGATIRYTTDGSTPSQSNGTVHVSPVNIGTNTTLKAFAYKSGTTDSAVASGVYTIAWPCGMPTFSPPSGTYTNTQSVTISSDTGGATIRYTTDGSAPSQSNGTVYVSPVNIGTNTTLKAVASKSGMTDSAVAYGVYNIRCATPTFSPPSGAYTNAQSVTISSDAVGATIRYTMDGSTPSPTNGTVYSTPVNIINASTTLKAVAYKSGMTDSIVASGIYVIDGALANFFNVLYTGSRTNWAGSMGFEFTPSSNIIVTALGRAVSGSMTHNHTIRIWKVSGQSLVASATVTPSSATDNLGYKYEALASNVTLTGGIAYRIASTETNGADAFMDCGLISNHIANVSISGYAYGYPDSVYPGSFGVATN